MKISLEQNRKRLQESKKRLNEGTSNFWSMDNFPLLIFGYYDDVEERVFEKAKEEIPNSEEMEYWEIQESPEYEKAWDEVDYCVLDESEIDDLKGDLEDFNYKMNRDGRYDSYEDAEVKLEIKPGYYEAAQIYVQDEKYLAEWQIDEISKFLDEIKKKYNLTQLGVAWRASNGETGYKIVVEQAPNFRKFTHKSDIREGKKANPAMKYKESANNTNDVEDRENGKEINPQEDSKEKEVVEGYFEEVDEELWEEFKKFKKIQESLKSE